MSKRVKSFLKNNFFTKKIYAKLRDIKYKNQKKRKRKLIKKKGVEVVHFLQSIFENSSYRFFFDMGTLLGIVREGRLLEHDLDVDVAVFVENEEMKSDVRKLLIANGCKLSFGYSAEGIGSIEDSFTIRGLKFDINYYEHREDRDTCYLMYRSPEKEYECNVMDVVMLQCEPICSIDKKDFFGKEINIPENAEHYLACRYGENWKVPDKNYIYWKGPSTQMIENKGVQNIY